ncbi:MAG: GMP synthase, partial [Halobacteriaceae archaeon]
CDIEAMSDSSRELYGVQWHPEVSHTAEGSKVFEQFLERC